MSVPFVVLTVLCNLKKFIFYERDSYYHGWR